MTNTSLPECLEAVFDCNSPLPHCQNSAGFDFPTLWSITTQYAKQCPNGPLLFTKVGQTFHASTDYIALTNEACEAIAGGTWKKYPNSDIWQRLSSWKFPLFQLVANSPRPPLGFWVEAFTMVHFLGDPVGTISDILRKVDATQSRAEFWQARLHKELTVIRDEHTKPEQRRLWKSLAIIVDSFDEWGLETGDRAQKYLLTELTRLCVQNVDSGLRHRYLRICLQTADALAADRSTKFVPVVIAQALFIGSVAIAMIRTVSASRGPSPSTYVNIEIYSIAFTAQYFWVIFGNIWKSIVGVSQSAAAIPRILTRLRWDLEKEVSDAGFSIKLPIDALDENIRVYNGGIYSWQPARHSLANTYSSEKRPSPWGKSGRVSNATTMSFWSAIRCITPFFVVAMAAGTGQLISALVPPEGWSCRSSAMMWMFVAWVGSYFVRFVPFRDNFRLQFWIVFVKDLIVTAFTSGLVIWTQLGIFNRCSCYTKDGSVGLQLPFMPAVRDILQSRLSTAYPAIVILGISIQLLLVPCLLLCRYHAAVQVYLQRDDGTSNRDWWSSLNGSRRATQYSVVGGTAVSNEGSQIESAMKEETRSSGIFVRHPLKAYEGS